MDASPMITPKTEAQRIKEERGRKEKLFQRLELFPDRKTGYPDFQFIYDLAWNDALDWRDANPLPHEDTVRLEWVIENEEQIFKSSKGWVALRSDKNMDRFCKTPREAIDAAIEESKK